MLFKLLDGVVTEIDIVSETFQGGYCETWFYDYEAQGIELTIKKDSGEVVFNSLKGPENYGNDIISYSDLMKFILNGVEYFKNTSSDDFVRMIKDYLENFEHYEEKNFLNYSEEFYEKLGR